MIMSGQLGPGRVDSGRCHEWTVRQLLQVGQDASDSCARGILSFRQPLNIVLSYSTDLARAVQHVLLLAAHTKE